MAYNILVAKNYAGLIFQTDLKNCYLPVTVFPVSIYLLIQNSKAPYFPYIDSSAIVYHREL